MGHITEFYIKLKLRRDTPAVVIDFLKRITAPTPANNTYTEADWEARFKVPEIDNRFFKCQRWDSMFCHSAFSGFPPRFKTTAAGSHELELHSELKNYDSEITMLVDWLAQYVKGHKKRLCVGWYLPEWQDTQQKNYMYIDFPYNTSQPLSWDNIVAQNAKRIIDDVKEKVKLGFDAAGKIIITSTPGGVEDNSGLFDLWRYPVDNLPKTLMHPLWASLECEQPSETTRRLMRDLYNKIKKDR